MTWIFIFILILLLGIVLSKANEALANDRTDLFWTYIIAAIIAAVLSVIMFVRAADQMEQNAIQKYIEGNVEVHDKIVDGQIVERTYKILNDVDYD